MHSDIVFGSLFRFCVENSGHLIVESDFESNGVLIYVKIPSKNIVLKQALPAIMDELEAIKYVENEVVKNFENKLNEVVSIKLKEG